MYRFSMIGASCTGKSTIAKRIAEMCDLVYVDEAAADHIRNNEPIDQFELYAEQLQRERDGLQIAVEKNFKGIITCSDLRLCQLYTLYKAPDKFKQFFFKYPEGYKGGYDRSFFSKIDSGIEMEDNGARYMGQEAEKMRWFIETMVEDYISCFDDNIICVDGSVSDRIKEIFDIIRALIHNI